MLTITSRPRIVPILAIIASIVLLTQQDWPVWAATGGYIVVGSILFFVARFGRRRGDRKIAERAGAIDTV